MYFCCTNFHVLRQRPVQTDFFAAVRAGKCQLPAVQSPPVYKTAVAAVQPVPCQRMSQMGKMYPDLMGSACVQFYIHKAEAVPPRTQGIFRQRPLTVGAHASCYDRVFFSCYRQVYQAVFRLWVSLYNGSVQLLGAGWQTPGTVGIQR